MITPLDIQKKEFRKAMRGYREEEVDAFLDQVIQDYEALFRENQTLKEKLVLAEQSTARYREIEEVLKNTMIMAQKSADELRQNAEKETSLRLDQARIEAEQITREAEQEAAALIQEADLKAAGMIKDAEEKAKLIYEEYHRMERDAQVFRMKFRAFLEAQMKYLDGEEDSIPAGDEHREETA
ncbi:Septum site-determining protein DivIVA [Pelotomaculum schinkii]|uniref:Septum site-determining protein DivIVA n=1 Tax=Pelotomaculum schinkii TaxID=78350 RepID=A0A4Y7RAN9_9FIRM|nr:DivIVA domain-containing protein [Pelotomaculum schinkii]TEB05799.1 Septum site-determining protein DivIVA [Pelotomaculum schinkii]